MNKRLQAMRSNLKGNWKIVDVEALCAEHGINCQPPSGGGSHYKISHAAMREMLTIPSKRPIKPIYIRKLVSFVESAKETQ
jgi:hypothetical protein